MENKTENNLKSEQINNSDKKEQKNNTSFSSSSSTASSTDKNKEGNNKKQKRKSDESAGGCSTIFSSSCSAPVSSDESNGLIDGKVDVSNNENDGGEGTAGTATGFNDSKAETEEEDDVLETSGMSNNIHENIDGTGEGSGCNGDIEGTGGHVQALNLENVGGTPCECVQCEVCMAENWWRMAAYQNTMLQGGGANGESSASPGFEIQENPRAASAAEGLGLIGSAAAMMLSQHSGVSAPTEEEVFRADFSMPKLREFFECQKQMGIPNFPEDFDEFWLLVVKARLFNIFKYRGPEAYNRIVLKIRDIALQFREQVEERERLEATAAISALQQNGGLEKQSPQKPPTNDGGGKKTGKKQRRKKGSSSGGSNNNYSSS